MERTSNFDHLDELDPGLAAFGRFAERYFVDDPDTTLIKARQSGERLAILVAESTGVVLDQRPGFADVLRQIQVDGSAPGRCSMSSTGSGDMAIAAHDVVGERRDAFELSSPR